MTQSWKITALAPRALIEAALIAHEDAWEWDPDIVLSGSEIAEDRPDDWQLEAWLPRKPTAADKTALSALFAEKAPPLLIERLPEIDWVVESQQGVAPIRAGQFYIRTPEHPPLGEPGMRDLVIPASRAFGTGQHATTAGCLEMLSIMKRSGTLVRNLADIGTGTGLLSFAAVALWSRTLATASDIDDTCIDVLTTNAKLNAIKLGAGNGEVTILAADGMDHPLLAVRGPYDLIIANILAGPLISLASDFAKALVPGGSLLLAGLLEKQEAQVRRACRAAGLRLARRLVKGDWSVLWLRKRVTLRSPALHRSSLPDWARQR